MKKIFLALTIFALVLLPLVGHGLTSFILDQTNLSSYDLSVPGYLEVTVALQRWWHSG